MLIIGELINCTRKRIGAAAAARDSAAIQEAARRQATAGADVLDVNGGLPLQEPETLKWLVEVVQDAVDLPLCLDSSDPAAFRAALPLCRRRVILSSITGEAERFDAVLPLVKEYGTQVVALAMGPGGTPAGVEDRMEHASALVERLTAAGIEPADIFVDPCVLPISVDTVQGPAVAEVVRLVHARHPGVRTTAGLSNVSFGLPLRRLLNRTYLVQLTASGLDSVIADPTDRELMAALRAAEALNGRDEFCAAYIGAYRAGALEPGVAPPPVQA